jgi:hypothetical protein
VALSALSALLCLGAVVLPAAASASGSISGIVTDAETEAPIEGLQVCAESRPEYQGWQCATTDSSGGYEISLEPHLYRVFFYGAPLGYESQNYDNEAIGSPADLVTVESDPVTGIDAALRPYGRIEGVVREAGTEAPLEEAWVCAWNVTTEESGRCDYTDANGSYAILRVPPGEYLVRFIPSGRGEPGTDNLVWQFYDHKGRYSEAEAFPVAVGQDVTGVDADLLPGARVEGVVRDATDHSLVPEVKACAFWLPSSGPWMCSRPRTDGTYTIQGLPAADYKIGFFPTNPTYPKWGAEYWDQTTSWDEAETLSLEPGTLTTGIDAVMEREPSSLPVPNPLAMPSAQPSAPKRAPRHCRRGFHKKRAAGKVRCVRKHHRRR